ncbi:MAG: hypothetical protein GTN49_07350 [candidate division Zixibacteria bacterium]|nr:hypothetical protein [candidate division Zixibacteria bacterium]
MTRPLSFAVAALALCAACGEDVEGPAVPEGSYWPARDKTFWRGEGRWHDLSGKRRGGPIALETVIAGTTYDGQGRPVKIWRTRETDGDYYFRLEEGEVWANWAENDPRGEYHLWLKLPPADGQEWEDDKYRVFVMGPFAMSVPFGDFGDVYLARYDYVEDPGHYESWWYARGVGCIRYEHYFPGDKYELVELVEFTPGG